MEAQKIKILINIRVSALKKSFEINVAKSGTLGELKQFIIGQFSSHLKAVEGELEIGLDVEDSIAQDWYDKTFEELEIGDGDTLYFSKNKKVDGSKIGKIYLLNATNKEWTVCVRPNIVGEIGKAERDITFTGPTFSVPIVGEIAVGGFKYRRGKIELNLPKDDEELANITIRCHSVDTIAFAHPTDKAISAKVECRLDGVRQDMRIVEHKNGLIITNNGVKMARIKHNIFTGKPKLQWKTATDERNLDPHQTLEIGAQCPDCNETKSSK